jgi:DNA-binding CsgD family transcriptional regulator
VVRLSHTNSHDVEQDSVGLRVRQRLTLDELSIVSYVVQGHKNRDIAIRLGTTEQSVKYALRKIFDKTGVFGRLELALFVMHHRTLVGVEMDARPMRGHASMVSLQRPRESGPRPTVQ